ncbi:MAG: hypothetical protein RJQ07_12525, partial [Pseudomonadales bacterium]
EFSEGVPRRINNVCDRLLLYAFLEELAKIDRNVVETVSNEIGAEFWGGQSPPAPKQERSLASDVFDTPQAPLENYARTMFDKADVQKRLTSLERAVDGLGSGLKPEIVEIREELSFLRLMMDDILHEVRALSGSSPTTTSESKKRAGSG